MPVMAGVVEATAGVVVSGDVDMFAELHALVITRTARRMV